MLCMVSATYRSICGKQHCDHAIRKTMSPEAPLIAIAGKGSGNGTELLAIPSNNICIAIFGIQLTVVLQCDWLRAWVINHLLPMLLWIISAWS